MFVFYSFYFSVLFFCFSIEKFNIFFLIHIQYKLAQSIVSIDANRIQLIIQKLIQLNSESENWSNMKHLSVYLNFFRNENKVCHKTISNCSLRLNGRDSNIMHWLQALIRICSKQLNEKIIEILLYSLVIFTYFVDDNNQKKCFTIRNVAINRAHRAL